MDDRPAQILLVEDSEEYALLVRRLLSRPSLGPFAVERAVSLGEGLARLAAGAPDLVLLDLNLPDCRGLETFDRVHGAAPSVPIVVLSGIDDEGVALEAVQRGAQDYLVKMRIDGPLLARAMRYAIERARAQAHIRALNTDLERRVAERTTELREANEALAKANAELRELDRMKSAFIDVTSHELRTPLVAVRGMLHVLRRRIPSDDATLVQAADAAVRASRRLEGVISRVLEVARSGEFLRRVERCTVRPAELVDDVVRTVQPMSQLRGQQLTADVPADVAPLTVARDRLRDVLLNLVLNAVKFTPDGGSVHISVTQGERDTTFRVRDTGVGIAEADQPHVFEPFFTTFDALHHSSGEFGFLQRGMGLGLTIAKSFVEWHGGTVGFESAIGQGSTFWFTIPRPDAPS